MDIIDLTRVIDVLQVSGGDPVTIDGVTFGCDWLVLTMDSFDDEGRHIVSEQVVRRVDNPRVAPAMWEEWYEAFNRDDPGRRYTLEVQVHNHPTNIYRKVSHLDRPWVWVGVASCDCR